MSEPEEPIEDLVADLRWVMLDTPARNQYWLDKLGDPLRERVEQVVKYATGQRPGWYQRYPQMGKTLRSCSLCGASCMPAIEVRMELRGKWIQPPQHHTYFFCLNQETCDFRRAVQSE